MTAWPSWRLPPFRPARRSSFSDREWTGSAFNSGEGGWSWTAPATDVAAGTVITISDISDQDGVPISANIGTAAGGSGLGADNEIVYAYVGPDANTPTAFLTAVANDTFTVDGGTLAGTGLTSVSTPSSSTASTPTPMLPRSTAAAATRRIFQPTPPSSTTPPTGSRRTAPAINRPTARRRTRRSRPRASRSAAPATKSVASPSWTRRPPCRDRSRLRWPPMPSPCRAWVVAVG